MAERKSGPVKPPVIELKAREASPDAKAPEPGSPRAAADSAPNPVVAPTPKSATPRPAKAKAEAAPKAAQTAAAQPKPEPVRPITAPPTPPPVRQAAKLAMPWSAISIAAIGGALLGTALTYALVNLLPLPSSAPTVADPTETLAALDGRLAGLEGRLPALENRLPGLEESAMDTQVSLDATITQIDTGFSATKAGIAALEKSLAEVKTTIPPAAPAVDITALTTQLDTLESRVTAIAAGASSADAAALADSLNTIQASVTTLGTRLDAASAKLAEIDRIGAELETAKAAIAAQTQSLAGADIGPAVKLPLLVSGLETAFAAGRPFTAELAGLTMLLPDLTVPSALSASAEAGLKRPDTIAVEFDAAVPAVLAGRTATSTGDWGKDAIEWAKGLLALRPSGEMEGDTPEAIVSRLEAAVKRYDFIAAAALLDQLPQSMQAAAGTVAGDIRAHAAADGFVAGLRAQALGPVAEAAP